MEFLNDYLDNLVLKLENYHKNTINTISSLVKKIAQDKKCFTENEKFVFNELFQYKELQTGIKQPKSKRYFITTNLLENKTNDPNNEIKFKHEGQQYYINVNTSKINSNVQSDIIRYNNGQDKTSYFMFVELADKINKEEQNNIYEKPLLFDDKSTEKTYSYIVDRTIKDKYGNDVFYHGYESGGAEGGSYTGTTASEYINKTPNSYSAYDFKQVTKLLEKIDPDISFLKYKRLTEEIKTKAKSVPIQDNSDYYGNYTQYMCSVISYTDLYTTMKDIGIDIDSKLKASNNVNNSISSKPKM